MLKAFYYYFIPEHLRDTEGRRLLSKLIVQFAVLAVVLCGWYSAIYYVAEAYYLLYSAIAFATLSLLLLFAIRFFKKIRSVLYSFLLILFFAFFFQAWYTGGGSSNVQIFFILIPLLCLFIGLSWGWYVFLTLSISTITFFHTLSYYDFEFPQALSGNTLIVFNFSNYALIYGLFLVFLPPFMTRLLTSYNKMKKAYKELKDTSEKLILSEKLASIGQLTAGIAHEINNPINYTVGGITQLKRDFKDMIEFEKSRSLLTKEAKKLVESGAIEDPEGKLEDVFQRVKELQQKVKYDELNEEIGFLLKSVEEGSRRTAEIVKGLRTFSRMDDKEFQQVDLTENIDSTLIILKHKWKNGISVEKNFGDLPLVECNPSKINQVILNLISNAIDAVGENGELKICAEHNSKTGSVAINVRDNGAGIPENIQKSVFDPFFTTKDVGVGTGLGLSVCKSIIDEHNGNISFDSKVGVGTSFKVELPVSQG